MSDMALPKTGAFPRFSTEEYARRQRDLRADMDADGLDALLIWGASIGNGEPNGAMNMASAYYLSNYADLLSNTSCFRCKASRHCSRAHGPNQARFANGR